MQEKQEIQKTAGSLENKIPRENPKITDGVISDQANTDSKDKTSKEPNVVNKSTDITQPSDENAMSKDASKSQDETSDSKVVKDIDKDLNVNKTSQSIDLEDQVHLLVCVCVCLCLI